MPIGFNLYAGNGRYQSKTPKEQERERIQNGIDELKKKYGKKYANTIDAYSGTLAAVGKADDFETLEETIAQDWLQDREHELDDEEYSGMREGLENGSKSRHMVDNIIRGRLNNEPQSIWESVKEKLLTDETKDINHIFETGTDRYRGEGALSEFSHGLARGYHSTKAIGHGLQAATGSSIDNQSMRDEGIRDYLEEMKLAEGYRAQNTFDDVWEDPSKFLPWLAGVAGEQAPVLASMFVTGGVGGVVGKAVAKKVITKEVGDMIKQGVINEATRSGLKKIAKGQLIGQTLGTMAGGTALETGSIYGDIYRETGEHRPDVALGFGTLAGTLEATPVLFLLRKYGGNGAAKGFIDRMTETIHGGSLPSRMLKAGSAESLTEGVQTVLERSAVKWVDENKEVFGEEGWRDIRNAMAGSFFIGGGMGMSPTPSGKTTPKSKSINVDTKLGNRTYVQKEDGRLINVASGEDMNISPNVQTPSERIQVKQKKQTTMTESKVEPSVTKQAVKTPSERVREKTEQRGKASHTQETEKNVPLPESEISPPPKNEVDKTIKDQPKANLNKDTKLANRGRRSKKELTGKEDIVYDDLDALKLDALKTLAEKVETEQMVRKKRVKVPKTRKKQELSDWIRKQWVSQGKEIINPEFQSSSLKVLKEIARSEGITPKGFSRDEVIQSIKKGRVAIAKEVKNPGLRRDIIEGRKNFRDIDEKSHPELVARLKSRAQKQQGKALNEKESVASDEAYMPKPKSSQVQQNVIAPDYVYTDTEGKKIKTDKALSSSELKEKNLKPFSLASFKENPDFEMKAGDKSRLRKEVELLYEKADKIKDKETREKAIEAIQDQEVLIDGTVRFAKERKRKKVTEDKNTKELVGAVLKSLKKYKSARDVDIIVHEKAPSWAGNQTEGTGSTKAAFKDGKVHFFADRGIAKEDLISFLRHEDFVHRWLRAADPEAYKKLHEGIKNETFTQAASLIQNVKNLHPDYVKEVRGKDGELRRELTDLGAEEVIAYYAQDHLDQGPLRKLIHALKKYIKNKFGIDIDSQELDSIIRESFKKYIEGHRSKANAYKKERLIRFAKDRKQKPVNTTTREFKRWFKGSQVIDEDGDPLVVTHGTTHDFSVFDKSKSNPENYLGDGFYFSDSPDDAWHHYAGEGPDLTNRIDLLAERLQQEHEFEGDEMSFDDARELARDELYGGEEKVLPVYLRFKNPLILDPQGGSRFEIVVEYDEDGNFIDEEGNGIELMHALDRVSARFGVENPWSELMDHFGMLEGQTAQEVFDQLRKTESVMFSEDDSGNIVSGEFLRDVAEEMGYDGIIMDVDAASFNMPEVPSGTRHYIAFEPTQIKSAISNTGEFSESNPDIFYARERKKKSKLDEIPGWREIRRYLTKEEKATAQKHTVQSMLDVFKQLPQDVEFIEAAKAGKIKKGWYQRAADALEDIFGENTEVFVALLAATSPRQTVDKNMLMALDIYEKWEKAGRPSAGDKDPSEVGSFFNVWTSLGEGSIMTQAQKETQHPIMKILVDVPGAWMRSRALNIIRALQGKPMSGDKVNSFKQNLLGDLEPSTNDTWMAQFANISQDIFGTKTGYKAFAAKIRRVAKKLGWQPAEVQETIWSFYKTLYEAQTGGIIGEQALELVDDKSIEKTPEFAKILLENEQIRNKLHQLGIGEKTLQRGGIATTAEAETELRGEGGSGQRILRRIARRAGEQRKSELAAQAETRSQNLKSEQPVLFAREREPKEESRAQVMGDVPYDQTVLDFDMRRDSDLKGRLAYHVRNIQARLQDRLNWIPFLHERIKEAGGKVTDETNAYLQEELSHSRIGVRQDDLKEEFINPIIKTIDKNNINMQDLDLYLYAKHAQERNAQIQKKTPSVYAGSGMTNTDAKNIIQEFEEKGLSKGMLEVEEMVRDMNEEYLDLLVRDGLEPQKTIDNWRNAYQYYVPLLGKPDPDEKLSDFEKKQNELLGMTKQKRKGHSGGLDVRGRESIVAKGRKKMATEPILANLFAKYNAAIVRAERAKAGRALIDLAIANPNPDFWEVGSLEYTTEFDSQTGEFTEVAVDPEQEKKLNEMLDVEWQKAKASSKRIFVTKKDGKMAFLKVNGNDDLVRQLKNLNTPQMHRAIEIMARINRVLAAINTSLNPEFVLTNMERDLQAAMVNISGEQDVNLAAKSVKDLPAAIRGIWRSERGKEKGDAKRADKSWADWYRDFKEAGGDTAFMSHVGVEDLVKKIEMDLRKSGNFRKAVDGIANFVEAGNKAIEAGIRLSAYKNMIEKGISKNDAASYAKNLTVNFNRKGEWGPVLNSLYMFYNAAVQANYRIYQASKSKKVRYMLGGAAALGTLMGGLGRWMGGQDDDGEYYYDKIPLGIKNTNIVFMNPFSDKEGDYFKIRLPYGYNVPYALGNSMYHFFADQTGALDTAANAVGAFSDSFNPMGSPSGSAGSILTQTASPTLTDPFVQIFFNQNFFGTPIQPIQNTYSLKRPKSENVFPSVGTIPKTIGKSIAWLGGGDEVTPGIFDAISNPEDIEHLIESYSGGLGRFVSNFITTSSDAMRGEELKWSKVPFARQFYGEKKPYSDRDKFQQRSNTVAIASKHYKDLLKTGEKEAAKDFFNKRKKEIQLASKLKIAEKQLRKLYRARGILRRKHREALESNESKSLTKSLQLKIKELDETIDKMKRKFNQQYKKALE